MELSNKFTEIYTANSWGSKESVSGLGSQLKNTQRLREELPYLLSKYEINSILDIPCGDFNWMREVELTDINYIGADIVPDIIDKNKEKYADKDFRVLDLTTDILPTVDLVFTRDCLGHLSNDNIFKALNNIQKSGSKYLLVTSFTKHSSNRDIANGSWQPINLMINPYLLKPIYMINENCQEGFPRYNDKCMILIDLTNMYSK